MLKSRESIVRWFDLLCVILVVEFYFSLAYRFQRFSLFVYFAYMPAVNIDENNIELIFFLL